MVLVVDDEFGIRHIIRLALARIGIDVTEASTAETALAYARTTRPDAVITDLRLPTMGGMELTRRLHAIDPTIPIVFISASTRLAAEADAAQVGVFLEKPFKLERLQFLIERLLAPNPPPAEEETQP